MSVENDDSWDSYKYTVKSHGERIERLERLHSASKDKLDLLMGKTRNLAKNTCNFGEIY
jgi:hypothetical protein